MTKLETPKNCAAAPGFAAGIRVHTAGDHLPTTGTEPCPDNFKDYCFKLQAEVEKLGQMDYVAYAILMWEELIGPMRSDISDSEYLRGYEHFLGTLISSLHGIDMSTMLTEGTLENLKNLIKKYGSDIEAVGVWSQGDVTATGYQVEKIHNSTVPERFMGHIATQSPPKHILYSS